MADKRMKAILLLSFNVRRCIPECNYSDKNAIFKKKAKF